MGFHEFVMGLLYDFIDALSPFAAEAWREEPAKWWRTPVKLANAFIDAYGSFDEFRRDWKWMRLLVPLQGRLLAEQILWDRGLPWRSLITGFRAIEGDAGETGVMGPPSPPIFKESNAFQTCVRHCIATTGRSRSSCEGHCHRQALEQ